jgi:hypothetical protein
VEAHKQIVAETAPSVSTQTQAPWNYCPVNNALKWL